MLALFGAALGLAQTLLPLQVGPINDYGQTLEADDRAKLSAIIASLESAGIHLVYLATWRDPFGDPARYAAEVFQAWKLSDKYLLLVFVRGEDRRWRVAIRPGAALLLPQKIEELRGRAELEANRARPGYAALRFASSLLSLLREGETNGAGKRFPWPYVLGAGLFVLLLLFLGRRICPRCGFPLRRVRSLSGIILVCPRCRYTRTSLRRGRRPGGRGESFP